MQLQFLAPVELFFKQLKGVAVFDPGGIIIFYDVQFSRCAVRPRFFREK